MLQIVPTSICFSLHGNMPNRSSYDFGLFFEASYCKINTLLEESVEEIQLLTALQHPNASSSFKKTLVELNLKKKK